MGGTAFLQAAILALACCASAPQLLFAATASEVRLLDGGEPPVWVQVFPAVADGGLVRANDGRDWKLDFQALLSSTAEMRGGRDLPIDFEHQTQRSLKNGRPAPAMGWIKELAVREGRVMARVEWTRKGAKLLKAREYRYLSPSFMFDKRTKVIAALVGAALVNAPAFDMPALAATQTDDSEEEAVNKQLLMALGAMLNLPEGKADEKAVMERLGLTKDSTGEQVEAAIAKVREELAKAASEAAPKDPPPAPDPSKFVPMAEFQKVAGRLGKVEDAAAQSAAEAAVAEAITAGKLAPASRDWALGYAAQDLEGFRKFAEAAPAILDPKGGLKPGLDGPEGGLTAAEVEVCKGLGLDEAAFVAARDGKPPPAPAKPKDNSKQAEAA